MFFVAHFGTHYRPERGTYCPHSLIHLASDVRQFGSLDKFSAFPFENAMEDIKRSVAVNAKSLHQLYNRRTEINRVNTSTSQLTYPFVQYRTQSKKEIRAVNSENFSISTSIADNVCKLQNGSIVQVDKIVMQNSKLAIVARYLNACQSFFEKPCDSKVLGIVVANMDNLSKSSEIIPVEKVERKIMKVPYLKNKNEKCSKSHQEFVLIPLLHHR